MLNVRLRQDAKDGFSVRGIVDIGTTEEVIDQALHLVVGKNLTVGDGSTARQAQGQSGMQIRQLRLLGGISHQLLEQTDRVKTLKACGHAIDGKTVTTQTADIEAYSHEVGHQLVEDNGIGIPENEIPMIFDRFYRAKNSGKNIKGTGIGLSIVKTIIDRHDATISVDSAIGKGTTFHIELKAAVY
jgi:C4-dicarboxylate-specific signal transduction histidine kinase